MKFVPLDIHGAYRIEPVRLDDERGFFARTFCEREFAEHKIEFHVVQCNTSFNLRRGTLRGMHFQRAPMAEAKLVRCTRGGLHDVIVDLREASPTYMRLAFAELSQENGHMLYIPEGIAHGFLTLEDNTEVFYQMSEFYSPEHASGVRWNDPSLAIKWPPVEALIVSEKDNQYADYKPSAAGGTKP